MLLQPHPLRQLAGGTQPGLDQFCHSSAGQNLWSISLTVK